jgi:hypothetical protein
LCKIDFLNGVPFARIARVQSIGDPITVGGVANIHGLSVFDAVYTMARGEPFGAK